jgi:hypothetical protein
MGVQGNYRWEDRLKDLVAPIDIGEVHKEFQLEIVKGIDYIGDLDVEYMYNII